MTRASPGGAGPSVELVFEEHGSLPALAWCLDVSGSPPAATLVHGPGVETGPGWFVEGAWDGGFEDARFDRSVLLMGSGGRLDDGVLRIATPAHNLEPLYLVADDRRVVVSNSLAFLLERTGLELDFRHLTYKLDLLSSMYGLAQAARSIPTADGTRVRILHYTNVEVGRDLRVAEVAKPDVPRFADYQEYRRFLADGLRAIFDNAASAARSAVYRPVATMSSGYDSPAAGALAAEAGCRRALTAGVGGDEATCELMDDSGRNIAECLGLEVTEIDPTALPADHESSLAELAACGGAAELNFVAFARELPGTVVTTGNSGGFWRPDFPPDGSPLARPDFGGESLGELRLRLGFVHVPVPMMGAIRHPDIHAISVSEEMRPWSVSGVYDRPIPRRILEQMGVPRDAFARVKKGGIIYVQPTGSLREYHRRHRSRRGLRARLGLLARWHGHRIRSRATKAIPGLAPPTFARVTPYEIMAPGPLSLSVHWGIDTVRPRYRIQPDRVMAR